MEGAAPVTPIEDNPPVSSKKTRKRHKKGILPARFSRRKKGAEPSILDEVPGNSALKKLQSGGSGGRRRNDKFSDEWNLMSTSTNPKNDNAPVQINENTYRIMDLNELQNTMNTMVSCKCRKYEELDNFVSFCVKSDSDIEENKMRDLIKKWKEQNETDIVKEKLEPNIKIQDKPIGVCSRTHLLCTECNQKFEIEAKKAKKFIGKGYNRGYNNHQKSSWYEANIRIVLGTIAAGLSPSDIETLFAFIGIPVPTSFPNVTFPKIENLIRPHIMSVSKTSMKKFYEKKLKRKQRKVMVSGRKQTKK